MARILQAEGDGKGALERLREGIAVGREFGISFEGGRLLGLLATISPDRGEQDAALAEGEALIAEGCVGRNQLYFYRSAIEAMLVRGDWEELERFAQALDDYATAEPLPWSRFFTARGRALADFAQGRRDNALIETLQGLRRTAVECGLNTALPALDDALTMAA